MTLPRLGRQWAVWAGATIAVTVVLLAFRGSLDKAHVALAYLLLVLAGSGRAGHAVGLALAAVTFLLFDWFFLLPYNTLGITRPLDWFVLVAFLVTSLVAAQLLSRAQAEARAAQARAAEVDRFATLGAETLSVARAADAVAAIASVIARTLPVTRCDIQAYLANDGSADSLTRWVAENGRAALLRDDGTTHLCDDAEWFAAAAAGGRELLLPLQVRDRTVGVIRLESGDLAAVAAQHRYVAALAYYAALALERVRLEGEAGHAAALREADRVKTALLASVSHDLRTPLTTIKALAHELTPSDERAWAIEAEADRLNRMVADLLDLSRVHAGAVQIHAEVTPIDDLVGVTLQRVAGATPPREIRVDLQDGGTLMVGCFDLPASVRIMVNLIDNASKYSPAGAAIDLAVARRGDMIELTVADRGPGVAPAEAERIFAAFYRPEGTLADVGNAGLGLAIARGLAVAQGGTLRYEPRPGGGATFILALPAADLPGVTGLS